MRRIVIIVVVLVCAAGGGWWWKGQRTTTATTSTVAFVTAERGVLTRSVAATGRVVSNLDVDIKCKASGVVVKLPVDISNTVKQGDLLIQLDPVDELRNVAQATAGLDASKARSEQARRNLAIAEATLATATSRAHAALISAETRAKDARAKATRMAELLKSKLASQEDADTAETSAQEAETELSNARTAIEELKTQALSVEVKRQDIVLAETEVTSDTIALDNAKQRLKDTTILAPIDGVVAARTVQIGTIISSGITNVGGGTAALTISDLSHLFVLAAVDESDIGDVQLGQSVRVTADAFPGRKFRGTVVRIATRGVNVSNVVSFEVKIEIEGEGRTLLRPEMTTNVAVVVESKEDVVSIPNEGLMRRKSTGKTGDTQAGSNKDVSKEPGKEDGKERKGRRERGNNEGWYVQLVTGEGTFEERSVKIGLNDGMRTEITEGLSEGDRVQVRKNEPASQWRGQAPSPLMPMGGGRPRP